MDPARYRRLALVVWAPLLAAFGIVLLQLFSGASRTLFQIAVASVGETPVSAAMGALLLVGAVALVQSDIGEPAY